MGQAQAMINSSGTAASKIHGRPFDHFTVRSLMEDLPPLETINAERPVREALAKMCAKKYSQLPVIEDGVCVGAITLESVMCQLAREDRKRNLGLNFMDWPVKKFVEKSARFVQPDDDLLKHIEWMAEKSFVIVGSAHEWESIVTNYDLVHFFKNKTEVFLLLREIETSLRFIVSKSLSEKGLKKALLSVKRKNAPSPSCIDNLTFDELRQLICKNWKQLKNSFLDQQKIDSQLQKIRELRNRTFHFRARITERELTSTRKLRDNYLNLAYSVVKSAR